jgi:putative addiction module killer protein
MKVRESEPYKKWYKKLKDTRAKSLIFVRMLRLEEGNRGDWGPVEGGLFELRIRYGPGYRLYCMERGKEIVVLLCGGDKSTQKADIARAKKIAENYNPNEDGE